MTLTERQEWEKQGFGEVIKSTSQTMQLLMGRVQPLIDSIKNDYPTDPFVALLEGNKLEWIMRTAKHILDSFGGIPHYE